MGCNAADHMRTDLCTEALAMTRDRGYRDAGQNISYRDQGAQFGLFYGCRT